MPRGFGFVTFDSREDAKAAIDMYHGTDYNGQKIVVELSRRRSARDKTPGKYLGRSKRRRS